jgi:hypothetical protein
MLREIIEWRLAEYLGSNKEDGETPAHSALSQTKHKLEL